MPVGQYEGGDVLEPVRNVAEVRQNQVNSGLVLRGKKYPAIDEEDFPLSFQNRHVAANFAESPQGDHSQHILAHGARFGKVLVKIVHTHSLPRPRPLPRHQLLAA